MAPPRDSPQRRPPPRRIFVRDLQNDDWWDLKKMSDDAHVAQGTFVGRVLLKMIEDWRAGQSQGRR